MPEDVDLAEAFGPLSDIRVVEMGQLIAGPFCGQLMADFGAEVIKIEPPGEGDPMRAWGAAKTGGKALWFPVIGRGKKSVTLDLRKPEGQEMARQIIAKADILIENFRPGALERWGLGYDVLSALNPGLIMVRVSGYGQTGPKSTRAGFGSIGEAVGGLRYVVGDPATPPSRMGISIGDTAAATYGCLGAMMALHARERTGKGQIVDTAIYEAVLAMMESMVTEFDVAGFIRERTGAILPKIAPSNVYPAKDGISIIIGANQDSVFRRLCEAMGRPELADDPRYAGHTARGVNQEELDALIGDWTVTVDSEELEVLLEEHGIPASRIYRAPEMLSDPHFQARESIVRVPHKDYGNIAMQNVMPHLSGTPGKVRGVGPELGEHNDDIYRGLLGLSADRVAELAKSGVI